MGTYEIPPVKKQDVDISRFEPMISVIIPFYNRKKHITECIESVLKSSMNLIEVICIDDGSTDGTAELLEKLAHIDSRIVFVKAPHQGAYQARWCGLKYARGEYIHFMDSDDMIEPSAYQELYEIAKKNNLDQVVFTAESFNAGKHTPSEAKVKDRFDKHYTLADECCWKVMDGKSLFDSLCRNKSFFVGFPMRLLKREMVQTGGILPCGAEWHADNFYTVVWMYWSKRAMAINRKFYKRRVHRASITMKKDEDATHFKSILSVIMSFCAFGDFVERGCRQGTSEYDYVFRLVRGLNKRRMKLSQEQVLSLIGKCEVWNGFNGLVPFIKMFFMQLLSKFVR